MDSLHNQQLRNTPSLDNNSSSFFNYTNVSPEVKSVGNQSDTARMSELETEPSHDKDDPYIFAGRCFIAVSVISALIILAFEIYIYAVINIHKKKLPSTARYTELSIYLALFIFASIFQIVLSYIGIRSKNLLLLMMLCVFYCCMVVYTGIQYDELTDFVDLALHGAWKRATRAINIAAIAVISITFVVQSFMIGAVLRKHVQWIGYKKVGADPKLRQIYLVYQVHRALLMLDFFFFLGFTVQFIVIMVRDKSSVEFILTVIVLPITILLLVWCDFSVTREIFWATAAAMVIMCCGCAYVLFKMIRLYTKYTSAYEYGVKPGAYFPGRKSLVTFGVITLVLLLTTIALELYLMANFRRGLKNILGDSYLRVPWHRPEARDEESLEID